MKKGVKVSYRGRVGVSHGLIEKFGIQWVLIEYTDGSKALVREESMEIIDESR